MEFGGELIRMAESSSTLAKLYDSDVQVGPLRDDMTTTSLVAP
jgi:hypothetical protein